MATITVCDRCGKPVTSNQGMTITIRDAVRGLNGEKELDANCAGLFAIWWETTFQLPVDITNA